MFTKDDVIYAYTRAQAVADGVLIDVSEAAREAGFRCPVAITRAVWDEHVAVPPLVEGQDEAGRLWDVLVMLRFAVAGAPNASEVRYRLHVRNDNREGEPPLVELKAVCGPDDDAKPCITVMLLSEEKR